MNWIEKCKKPGISRSYFVSRISYQALPEKLIDKDIVEEAKELISALGLPVIQAPSEAEAQCAYMCKKKLVWAVSSQDFDTLIFGSPRMVRNLTISVKKKTSSGVYVPYLPEVVELSSVLN